MRSDKIEQNIKEGLTKAEEKYGDKLHYNYMPEENGFYSWEMIKQQKSYLLSVKLHLQSTDESIIKYPEMVAEIFPHFDGNEIPTSEKNNLWFL